MIHLAVPIKIKTYITIHDIIFRTALTYERIRSIYNNGTKPEVICIALYGSEMIATKTFVQIIGIKTQSLKS
jgi:hypothetical protein